jgi:hypothetical protein
MDSFDIQSVAAASSHMSFISLANSSAVGFHTSF